MSITGYYEGYYDDNGYWRSNCTCQPPNGLIYDKSKDKRLKKNKETDK